MILGVITCSRSVSSSPITTTILSPLDLRSELCVPILSIIFSLNETLENGTLMLPFTEHLENLYITFLLNELKSF